VRGRANSMPRRNRDYSGIMLMPRGNGLLGEQHQEVLALFRSLEMLRRYVMSHAVEVLEVTSDIKTAVQTLRLMGLKGNVNGGAKD
jgi:hypothetical protein